MTRSKKLFTLLIALLLLAMPALALANESGGTNNGGEGGNEPQPALPVITVTAKDILNTYIYDGTRHYVTNNPTPGKDYTVEGTLNKDHTLVVTLSGSGVTPGDYNIVVTAKIVETAAPNTDVSEQYTIVPVNGILRVDPCPITIKPEDVSAVYDGNAHGATKAVLAQGSNNIRSAHRIVLEEGAFTNTGALTNVDTNTSTLDRDKIKIKKEDNDVTHYYAITVEKGSVEVTAVTDKITVTVKGEQKTETYNGSEQTAGYEVVSISNPLYEEENIAFAGGAKGTDAGTYTKTLTAADFSNNSENFTNVEFVVQADSEGSADSKLTITPINGLTVKVKGKTTPPKVYNGEKQTYAAYEIAEAPNLYKAEYITFNGKCAEGTDVNTYPMGLKATDFENKNPNFTNVTFVVTADGSMTIDPRPITIAPKAASKVYDGTPLKATEAEVTSETKLVSGHKINATFVGEKIHVLAHADDATNSTIGNVQIMSGSTDVTANYDITVGAGTLTVTPRAIALASGSATKEYDGTALKNSTITASNSFVKGDTATCTMKGTQTYGGTSDNTFTYAFKAGENSPSLETDYAITPVYGKLIVTPREITLTSGTSKKTYDGKKLVNTEVAVGGDDLAKGDTIGIKETDTIYVYDFASNTKVGKVKNEFRYKFLNDNYKNSYEVTSVKYGELKISASGSSTQTGVDDRWPTLLGGSALLLAASAAIVLVLKKKTRRNDG